MRRPIQLFSLPLFVLLVDMHYIVARTYRKIDSVQQFHSNFSKFSFDYAFGMTIVLTTHIGLFKNDETCKS